MTNVLKPCSVATRYEIIRHKDSFYDTYEKRLLGRFDTLDEVNLWILKDLKEHPDWMVGSYNYEIIEVTTIVNTIQNLFLDRKEW